MLIALAWVTFGEKFMLPDSGSAVKMPGGPT